MVQIHLTTEGLDELSSCFVKYEAELIYADEAALEIHKILWEHGGRAWHQTGAQLVALGFSQSSETGDPRIDFLEQLVERWTGATYRGFLDHLAQGLTTIDLEFTYNRRDLERIERRIQAELSVLGSEPDLVDEDEFTQDFATGEPLSMRQPEAPPLTASELRRLIRNDPVLGSEASRLEPLVAQSVGLVPTEGKRPTGGARLFGQPDLPAGISWPTRGGKRIPFLLQVPMSQVHEVCDTEIFPEKGTIFVFGDEQEMRVIFSKTVAGAVGEGGLSIPLKLVPRASLPSPWMGEFERFGFDSDKRQAYEKIWRRVERSGRCYLLGYPAPRHENPMRERPEFAFLLQIDLEEAYGEAEGGAPCMYAAVAPARARRGDFGTLLHWVDR